MKIIDLMLPNTKAKQIEIECETGVHFSVLLNLPYFDAPRMCIIDPMHNLFLGSDIFGKKMKLYYQVILLIYKKRLIALLCQKD